MTNAIHFSNERPDTIASSHEFLIKNVKSSDSSCFKAGMKGTKFLGLSHKISDSGQCCYLPELKRVKPISSSRKGGAFEGSEFSNEDMSPPVIES